MSQVPSLEYNNEVRGESLDLIKFIDSHFEGPSLFPSVCFRSYSLAWFCNYFLYFSIANASSCRILQSRTLLVYSFLMLVPSTKLQLLLSRRRKSTQKPVYERLNYVLFYLLMASSVSLFIYIRCCLRLHWGGSFQV